MLQTTVFRDLFTMSGRNIRQSLREIDALLIGIILPISLLIMFTYVFGGAIDPTGNYLSFIVPSTILLCAGYGAGTTAISVTKDLTQGATNRFRSIGVSGIAVIGGHVTASVIRNLVSTSLVIGVALLIGFRPSADFGGWLLIAGLITLFIVTLSWFAAMFGVMVRSIDAASTVSFVILFLPYISSAFVPIATLPSWLQPVAEHQPFTPLVESLRGLFAQAPLEGYFWIALVWCLGILGISLLGSALLWRRLSRT